MNFPTISVKTKDLIPYARNSRTHSDEQVTQIASSIREFGFTNPVIIDDKNNIIAGHGRVMAAKKLGLDEVPCVVVTGWTDAQKKAYVIADNKLALNAGWDEKMLSLEFDELQELGFDLSLTGFSKDEILALKPLEETVGLTDEDEVPEPPETPVTVLGDIWLLGDHRLMCGDSTSIDAVEKLMAGQKADMVFTDPPYRIETQGGCKGSIGKSLCKQGAEIDFISSFNPSDFLALLPTVFSGGKINAYVFCNKDLLPDYLVWARDAGFSFNVLIWKKPNAIPIGDSHRPDIEYLLVFRKSAIWNNGLKDVNYSRCIEHGRETGLHPTMKPVAILENQIKIASNNNSPVLDLFGGSGSTLIACEKTGRHCRMMELDPKYCDVIIKRWQDFTGKKAIHAETGKPFDGLKNVQKAA
jgi:DNA modification methylase